MKMNIILQFFIGLPIGIILWKIALSSGVNININ